jgi:hypothetical protein
MLSPDLSQQRPQAPFSLTRRLGPILWLLEFPALSVLVFIRRGIGYRLLSPARFNTMVLLAVCAPGLLSNIVNSGLRYIPFVG